MRAPPRITVRDGAGRDLSEPALTDADIRDYLTGWELFNRKHYWHAHEAWEAVWKRHPEPSRLFFEGIIQLAAACHLLAGAVRYRGTVGNFAKAEERLKLFGERGRFLGVDVHALLQHIRAAQIELERVGAGGLRNVSPGLLPRVACTLTSPRGTTSIPATTPSARAPRSR
jgi:hypothetical protein